MGCIMKYANESKSIPNYIDVTVHSDTYRVNKSCNSCEHNTCPNFCYASKSSETMYFGCSNYEWNQRN